jgi:hypothetical protein
MPVIPIPVVVMIPAVIMMIPSVPKSEIEYDRREPGPVVEGIIAPVIRSSKPGIIPAPIIIKRRIIIRKTEAQATTVDTYPPGKWFVVVPVVISENWGIIIKQ